MLLFINLFLFLIYTIIYFQKMPILGQNFLKFRNLPPLLLRSGEWHQQFGILNRAFLFLPHFNDIKIILKGQRCQLCLLSQLQGQFVEAYSLNQNPAPNDFLHHFIAPASAKSRFLWLSTWIYPSISPTSSGGID